MASDTEPDGMSLNGDCEMDDDTALSPMSSLLVPEIALSDDKFDDGTEEFEGTHEQNGVETVHRNGIKMYKCDVCEKEFKRKAHLRRHYRLHTGERPYDCQWCGQTFARSEQRNQHIVREHNQSHITCTICGKGFRNDEDRMNHMVLHLENKYFRCTICMKEFDKANALAGHMQVHTTHDSLSGARKTFKCTTCDMDFSRFDHLIRHQTVHSGVKMFQCKFCMKRFTRADNRTKHEKTCRIGKPTDGNENDEHTEHAESVQIKTEPQQMDPLAIINVASIAENYFEDIDTSNNTDDLLDSIELFSDEPDATASTLHPVVDKKLNIHINPAEYVRMRQSEADRDLKKLGGIRQRVDRPKLTREEIETLTCNICGKTLAQKYHLVRHKIIHLNHKPYKCLKCSRSFARREHLRHHLFTHKRQSERMNHLQQHRQQSQSQSQSQPQLPTPPPLQHHGRNLRSSTNAVLKLEPKITTASISNTIKPEDTLTGTLRQQLLHRFKLFAIKLKVENMNRENGDFYEQCFNFMGNLIMSNIQGVNKEMFSMTSNTSKPTLILKTSPAPATQPIDTIKREDNSIFIKKFSCNNCDATFPSLRHLERHSVQHTGEKPHICEVCGNRFTRAEHKRRHMAIHTNAQNYECEICLKKFNRSDHMVAHFKVHHHGIKPYKCKFLCGERFDTFKEKLFHSRHCMYIQPAPDSIDKDDELMPSSVDSQDDVPLQEDPFAPDPTEIDVQQFQSHFIKTEADYPEDNYDEMYGY